MRTSGSVEGKVRIAAKEKIPYIVVVGAKEAEEGTVSVRARERQDVQETMTLEAFVKKVSEEATLSF